MNELTSDLLTATSIFALLASAWIARRNGVLLIQTTAIVVMDLPLTFLYLLDRVGVITLRSPSGPAVALVASILISMSCCSTRLDRETGRSRE